MRVLIILASVITSSERAAEYVVPNDLVGRYNLLTTIVGPYLGYFATSWLYSTTYRPRTEGGGLGGTTRRPTQRKRGRRGWRRRRPPPLRLPPPRPPREEVRAGRRYGKCAGYPVKSTVG